MTDENGDCHHFPDEQLMMRAARGDMGAFQALVERRQQGALNVAYRFLSDRSLAEDVVQEAFLKILAAAGRYRPKARFSTYLYNVVWHLCVDQHRRRRPAPLHADAPLPARGGGPEEHAVQAERAELVRKAVAELPPRQRMAVILKHFESMSYKQISEALGCSQRAVDALLVRARRKLLEALEGKL